MIDVEVLGESAPPEPQARELQALCCAVAARLHLQEGHLAIEFVAAQRIAELNLEHRGKAEPTDVLSFPIDGAGVLPPAGHEGEAEVPRELGDIIICPEHTADIREAVVHGMLHLLGMDHERDRGEMLALQRELLAGAGR